MASIVYIVSICQLLIHIHKMELTKFEIRVILKHYQNQDYKAALLWFKEYMKWKEKVSLMGMWHKDGSNVSTLEKKTQDLPSSGRPKLWDIENIHRVFE